MTRDAAVPLVDLNTTPLIDVMLVLLIIFMIAAPMLAHEVPVPGAAPPSAATPPPLREVSLEVAGDVILYTIDGVAVSRSELAALWRAEGRSTASEQGRWRLVAGPEVRFEAVANLLAEGRRAGLVAIGVD